MIERVRKAVFPVAGLGTRLLPATKAIPKEMLTIVDKPLIHYAVEEARAAGIEHFIFVTGRNKAAIEDYFDVPFELQAALTERGLTTTVAKLSGGLPAAGATSFTRQHAPLGLGHAVWCARDIVGDEPFAVLLPDAIARGEPGCLAQIMETYALTGANVVSVEECNPHEVNRYGVVGVGEGVSKMAFRATAFVEKPEIGSAPSNLKISGRYILQPEIFRHLSRQDRGVGGEIQLTDAIARLAGEQPVFGHRFRGRSYDCGSREGLIAANVAFALDDPRLASIVRQEIDAFFRRKQVSALEASQ
jgi:UTP--glucose-1-phosphate uridylyltransferase